MSRKEIRIQKEKEERIAEFRKRIEFCLAFFVALLMLLILRLYYIQLGCHDDFERAAKSQQEITASGFDAEYNFYYIIEKSKIDARLKEMFQESGGKDITKKSPKYAVYGIKTYDSYLNEKLRQDYGAYAFRNYVSAGMKTGKKFKAILYADAAGKIIPGLAPKIREQI